VNRYLNKVDNITLLVEGANSKDGVVSIKAIGIAIKLTLDGISQIAYPHTWFVLTVATMCHYTTWFD
ncbi:putative magnesium transporter NIPA6, partial [Mucuna pruriens]